jgi:hypothetical protein
MGPSLSLGAGPETPRRQVWPAGFVDLSQSPEQAISGETNKRSEHIGLRDTGMCVTVAETSTEIWIFRGEILGCAFVHILCILLLQTLILQSGVYYYSDDVYLLYPVAAHSLTATPWLVVRPLQYLIVLAANHVYLPLWLGASLLCVVGATILSALACERLFERQLPKAGWWILSVANPLLFYLVSQPDIVSQALCNLLFAGTMLAFISESHRLRGQPPRGWRADCRAAVLNFMAAALFFTKETGVAAAIVIPAATALIRLKAGRLSSIFLFSLLLPIAAACGWIWLRLQFLSLLLPDQVGARYSPSPNPITWLRNFVITVAFPVTPLPSSFIEFELLRPLWVVVAFGSVTLFTGLLLRECRRRPAIVFPLFVVAASCSPMIFIRTDELYPSMIGPFAVSIVLLFAVSKIRRLSLAYGLLLYVASLGNAIIYYLGADFNLVGLKRFEYSIYSKKYQSDPICAIGTTAHVAWDGTAASDLPGEPGVKGRIVCIR